MAVTFQLYQSNGTTPVYTFPVVFEANYPHSEKKLIEHTNPRAKGSIFVDGGEASWILTLKGVLKASGYGALMALVDGMEDDVVLNTPYVLIIESDETGVTSWTYNVKRTSPIEFQNNSLRTDYIEYTINLSVNSW